MNNNFSVDDIHAIRERNTRKYLTMSAEELKEYFRKQEEKFYNSVNEVNDKDLQLAQIVCSKNNYKLQLNRNLLKTRERL